MGTCENKQDDHVSAEEHPPFENQEDRTHESVDLPTLVSFVAGHPEQAHFPWSSHHQQAKWRETDTAATQLIEGLCPS